MELKRFTLSYRLYRFLLRGSFLAIFFIFAGCHTAPLKSDGNGTQIELLDHKIAFVLPTGWTVQFSEKRYFQLTANTGTGPYAPGIEYRGLNTDLTERALMDQYARGWYTAMARNFPNFEFTERNEMVVNNVPTYYFEGTFTDGNLRFKKIGYLRFVNLKIHAIYYTAPIDEFDTYLPVFHAIDDMIRYLN